MCSSVVHSQFRLVAIALTPRESILLEKAHLFQKYQVTKNITGLATIFAEDSVTNIPIGTARAEGKKAVLDSFEQYFGTIKTTSQKIIGDIEINEGYLIYSKIISAVNIKDCPVTFHVINWYHFNDDNMIKEFSAVFNLTNVKEQGSCRY